MPSEKTLRLLAAVAQPIVASDTTLELLRKRLYTGWDFNHVPYGHLTEHGAQQLREVGHELHRRYMGNFLPKRISKAVDHLYCRSTNLCRTMLSLRSLLNGFLVGDQDASTILSGVKLPTIFSRLKQQETMYPHADGPCLGMTERRLSLINNQYNNASNVPAYANALEERLKRVLGIQEPLTWLMWLNIMDIMICYKTHNVALPRGVSDDDVRLTIEFVSWVWGSLYKVIFQVLLRRHGDENRLNLFNFAARHLNSLG